MPLSWDFYHIFLDLDSPWQSFFKGRFYEYQCFAHMYECAPRTYLMPEELRRGHHYRRCEPLCRCWAPDPRPLQEQQMPLIAELNLEILGSPLEVHYFYWSFEISYVCAVCFVYAHPHSLSWTPYFFLLTSPLTLKVLRSVSQGFCFKSTGYQHISWLLIVILVIGWRQYLLNLSILKWLFLSFHTGLFGKKSLGTTHI